MNATKEAQAGDEDDRYGFKALMRKAINEQSEKYRAELAAGPTPEHKEEIKAWFAFQRAKERLDKARAKRAEKEGPLADLPRPGLMN